MQFELVLTDDYPSRAPAELEVAAASLTSHAIVDVSLMSGTGVLPLAATLTPLSGGRGVSVSVPIPAGAGRNSQVVINAVTVARQPVVSGLSLPMAFSVVAGMHAPLILKGAVSGSGTPVITSDGTLYVPNPKCPSVQVFSADGTPLPPLYVGSVGLSKQTRAAAYVNSSNTLLLADCNGDSSKLVAVDMTRHLWTKVPGMLDDALGIAVLSQQGVVVVSSIQDDMLHAYRLSDGTRIASVNVTWCTYLASDPAAATIYVSSGTQERQSVVANRWDGTRLVADGTVEAAGVAPNNRLLAVMPPDPGLHTSYLIVGTFNTPALHVISLPDRRLFHTHTLEGMGVMGLAADPSGNALAVCDFASAAVHVLPWPLPGMPALT
jgi:DNA-binding beta-propeller fold protein YncE